ncbi:MAG: prepilin-type N-terminal cleavage/methylation domain-containing protein [Inhella sp.]|uniref:prepilin-type N-terminal cleavage/methylation domain-containing protein n=1 Tax=Inhella sp. TaxID=1921806 RepID=UPI0022C08DF8|nr:prepilin-type N-terminal cleavage/methylation domain-containing protein [Inhella sp.]MCZ8234238.1 prepilin-type N-terminal cleavage/methylation domain-containing protein [Inhella sp.]
MRRQGVSLLEVLVVLSLIAVLATVLLHRLAEVSQQARRVQLQMAAESTRIHAQLLFLRCGGALDPACWQAAQDPSQLARWRPADDPRAVPPPEAVTVLALLQSIARAAGLSASAEPGRAWRWEADGDRTLQVTLQDVPQCRFSLHWPGPEQPVRVQDVQTVCR